MTAWDNILNTALLGTEKKQPDAGMLNGELATCWTTAAGQGMPDAEEAFLRMAALGYNYRRCGFEPLPMPQQEPATAPAEDKPYCTTGMMQLLDEVAETGAAPLLQFWLSQCAASNYVVPGDTTIQGCSGQYCIAAIRQRVLRQQGCVAGVYESGMGFRKKSAGR